MDGNELRKSTIWMLVGFLFLMILLILFLIDEKIAIYFFGISLVIFSMIPFFSFFLEFRKSYLNQNPKKSNDRKIIYFIKTFWGIFKEVLTKIVLLVLFLIILIFWFGLPLIYFHKKNSIYYSFCLPLFGGVIGEIFWGGLYLLIMYSIGIKILDYLEFKIEKLFKILLSKFDKFK